MPQTQDNQPEDDDEEEDEGGGEQSLVGQMFMQARTNGGAVVLEVYTCECGHESFASHCFQPILKCQHCNAGVRSVAPRRPAKGEVTLEHVETALSTLRDCYANAAKATPLTGPDMWASLTPELQLYITQRVTPLVVSALAQVTKLAIGLAEVGS